LCSRAHFLSFFAATYDKVTVSRPTKEVKVSLVHNAMVILCVCKVVELLCDAQKPSDKTT
jgi:hypothetical protein